MVDPSTKTIGIFWIRLLISLVIYVVFICLYATFGFYLSFIVVLSPSIIFVLYLFSLDGFNFLNRRALYVSVLIFTYFLIIIFLYPSKKLGSFVQTGIKASFEELLFRFCMIGVVRKFLDFESKGRVAAILLINSFLFSLLHTQYELLGEYATIFLQGVNYGLTYVSLGIIPSIVSHLIWNLYFPNILPQIPILIMTILNIYYVISERRLQARRRRMTHTR